VSTSEDKSPLPEAPDSGGMSCAQARRQIERLIEDCDLREIERALLMAHVRNCRPCKAELDSYRRLENRLKEALAPLDTAPHFSARVLAVLPEADSRDAPEWEKKRSTPRALVPSGVFSSSRDSVRRSGPPILLHCLALSAGLAALVMLAYGLTQLWRHGSQSQAAPRIMAVTGPAEYVKGTDTNVGRTLSVGDALLPSDSILAMSKPVVLTLQCGPRRTSTVSLAPGSKLQALNRNCYILLSGAGYFEVQNDSAQAVPAEAFDVDAGGIALVRVTGTTFGVDLSSGAQGGVIIFVEQGAVQVRRPGQPEQATVSLVAGEELSVARSGTLSTPQAFDRAQRLAWLPDPRRSPPAKQLPPGKMFASVPEAPWVASTPGPAQQQTSMNWDATVKDVALKDRDLAEGIDMLAEVLDRPPQLLQLRSQIQGLFVANTTLSFALHNEMPLQAALRWMARDVSVRFGAGPEGQPCFVTAAADALPGQPASGVPPEFVRKALETPSPRGLRSAASPLTLVEELSKNCGVTIVLDRALLAKQFAAHNTVLELRGQTVGQKLDSLLAALHASLAWYDYVLYVAAPSRIEALTVSDRSNAPGPELLGRPLSPAWAKELKELVSAQTYPPEQGAVAAPYFPGVQLRGDVELAGRPAFVAPPVVDPNPAGGPAFRYRTGLLGHALMSNLLESLRTGSPAVPGISGMLSTPATAGTVADIKGLVEQVSPFLRVELAPGLKPPSFDKQAFVSRNLRLGEALEWAAWLAGCGLRQDNDVWLVDDAVACYGAPAMQVLSLAPLAVRSPALAPEFPGLFTRLLPELYPGFFSPKLQFRCIGNRLVFTGDKRQLQLAQRLLTALEAANPAGVKEARNWKPAWRLALENNLADPFKSDAPKLSGSFAWLLRQSGLGTKLRFSVLVYPAAMREKAGVEIRDLDVAGLSVGQVVERLAQAAGLRMVLEGEIVCLRP